MRPTLLCKRRNYQKKFDEYLSDPENIKWEEIANEGREHTLNVASNDRGVDSLIELIEEFIK